MKPNQKPPQAIPPPAAPADSQPETKLNLTPEEAKRDAAKLREYREKLEARKTMGETDARSSPLGRTDE